MELTAIVKEYNVPLTRTEESLLSRLGTDVSSRSQDRYEQQMKDLAAARTVVRQLPDRQTLERQSRLERAGILKERLKMLRQMIPFLSPSATKSVMAEMKQIAAQIASLGAGSGSVVVTATDMASPETAASAKDSGGTRGNTQEAAQPAGTGQRSGGTTQQMSPALSGKPPETGNDSAAEERRLKEAVEDVKTLFKSVLAALKRKRSGRDGNRPQQPSPRLQVYAAMPEGAGRVAVKV